MHVMPLPKLAGFRKSQVRLGCHRHNHHVVAIAVVKFSALAPPDRIGAAIGRNLDLGAWTRTLGDEYFGVAGLIRTIGQPLAIWGKLGGGLQKPRGFQQSPRLASE